MQFTNRTYNTLKFVALVLLPALAAAYFSLSQVWSLPNSEQIVGTITVLDTLLGVLLKSSTNQYNKTDPNVDGELYLEDDEGHRYLQLGVNNENIATLPSKDTVTFRVVPRRSVPE